MRLSNKMFAMVCLAGLFGGLSGCELIADFDRDKIPVNGGGLDASAPARDAAAEMDGAADVDAAADLDGAVDVDGSELEDAASDAGMDAAPDDDAG